MRGEQNKTPAMFSYIRLDERIPKNHPLRAIRDMTDIIFKEMTSSFDKIYSRRGRPSIPPEELLRALLLQVLYTIRSERQLIEQLQYNFLYRWFVGLDMDDSVWNVTVFTKNRERLLCGSIAEKFFDRILHMAHKNQLLSNDHFSMDGSLIEAWAGLKSFQRKDSKSVKSHKDKTNDPGNPEINFHGEKRKNETHSSRTDPQALLYRKGSGKEAKLCYAGHVLMENRNGLAIAAKLSQATGVSERQTATEMLEEYRKSKKSNRRITLGCDRGYHTKEFIRELRKQKISPHVALNRKKGNHVDGRTTHHKGYEISQRKRKRVEEIFGWLKTVGMLRKVRHRGLRRVNWMFVFAVSVYNLLRMRNLLHA